MTPHVSVIPNSPRRRSLSMYSPRIVWPLPANVAANRCCELELSPPIGRQPAPSFHQSSPASAAPFPLVSKSRSATSSYPMQPPAGQPFRVAASGNAAVYAAHPAPIGTPSPSRSCRTASSWTRDAISISPSSSRS